MHSRSTPATNTFLDSHSHVIKQSYNDANQVLYRKTQLKTPNTLINDRHHTSARIKLPSGALNSANVLSPHAEDWGRRRGISRISLVLH